MALTRIQSSSGINDSSLATSVSTVSGISTSSGNCILVAAAVRFNGADLVGSVTDTAGNSYSKLADFNSNGLNLSVWIATNITGNIANIVTADHSAQAQRSLIIAEEWSGVVSSSALDGTNEGTDSSSPLQTPSFTTTNADNIIWSAWAVSVNSITYSLATGFSNLTTTALIVGLGEIATASKVVSSTGSYTADMDTDGSSTPHVGIGVGIKAAASVGNGSTRRMLLGVG